MELDIVITEPNMRRESDREFNITFEETRSKTRLVNKISEAVLNLNPDGFVNPNLTLLPVINTTKN